MARRFAVLAREIVIGGLVRVKKNDDRRAKATAKIRKDMEFDARLKPCATFMKAWNHWRKFYLELEPMEIKTRGQITQIENAIDFCKAQGFDLNLVIACIHRSFRRRKLRPNFGEIESRGAEHLSQADDVAADVENADNERMSY